MFKVDALYGVLPTTHSDIGFQLTQFPSREKRLGKRKVSESAKTVWFSIVRKWHRNRSVQSAR